MSPSLNIATLLTWFRIAAIPLIVLVFYLPPGEWMRPASAMIFALAGITDWLDGYLARRLNLTSKFGAFLDPVADKLMVTTTLVLIVQAHPTLANTFIAAIIIGREITVSALREWMAELGARSVVAGAKAREIRSSAIGHPGGQSGWASLRVGWGSEPKKVECGHDIDVRRASREHMIRTRA